MCVFSEWLSLFTGHRDRLHSNYGSALFLCSTCEIMVQSRPCMEQHYYREQQKINQQKTEYLGTCLFTDLRLFSGNLQEIFYRKYNFSIYILFNKIMPSPAGTLGKNHHHFKLLYIQYMQESLHGEIPSLHLWDCYRQIFILFLCLY